MYVRTSMIWYVLYYTHSQVIVIRVPEWTTSILESTISTLAALSNQPFISLAYYNVNNIIIVGYVRISKDMITRVTIASIQLYTSVKNVLRDSTLPGRCHYMFSLSQLVSLSRFCPPLIPELLNSCTCSLCQWIYLICIKVHVMSSFI